MARKKEKLKVDLELPKNDTTMVKLYFILGIGMILGVSSMGFWFINSPFLPTPNGQPMFINIACGWDPTFHPDLDANESCDLMHDEPHVSVYEAPKTWTKVLAEGQRFTAPGLLPEERGNYSGELNQAFELKCEAKADVEIPYTLELWDETCRKRAHGFVLSIINVYATFCVHMNKRELGQDAKTCSKAK